MKHFAVFSLFLAVCLTGALSQLDPSMKQAIDQLIQDEYFTKGKISGLGLAIVKDGQVLYSTGYGYRDLEDSIPADSDSLFIVGSITKSFTATLAVKILSEKFPELGESVLDTPIRKLVPSFNLTLSDRFRSEQTSFRDLLSHRVCEVVQDVNLLLGTTPDINDLIYRLRYSNEQCPFRTNFVYNNGHFTLAGELLAEITGVPFLQMLEEFMAELGMTSSSYVKNSDDHDNMPNRAVGYYWKDGKLNRYNGEYYKVVAPMIAAGGMVSNANDIAKYALFRLNSGRVGDKQLIPEEVMNWMYKNSNPFRATTPDFKTEEGQREYFDIGYGLAFFLGSYDGWQVYEHSGSLGPFKSQLTFFPGVNLSIFTTASTTGAREEYTYSHDFVYKSIFDIIMGETGSTNIRKISLSERIEQEQNYMMDSRVHKSVQKSGQVYQAADIVGHYGNGLYGELDIEERLNLTGQLQPYLTLGKWGTGFLNEKSSNMYSWEIDSDYVQSYYSNGFYEGPQLTVSYDVSSMLAIEEDGFVMVYEKGQVVDNLPVQPWSPDSCGPRE